jgi:pimeloyl-ACP methyl ester carboxylesterase
LDRVFDRCAKDSECSRTFPEIAQQFEALRARVQKEQLATTLPDPLTADAAKAQLGSAQLGAAVRLLTYSDVTVSTLPLLIHEAQVQGRPEALAAQYLMIQRSTEEQIAYGMHFAVVCSEDAPRWHTANVGEEALKRTYLGTSFMEGMRAICESWPRGPVDPDFSEPLHSDLPVLLLSGANDPVTPARYGEQAKTHFKRSRHLVLDGQGHGQIAKGCVPRLAAEFVSAASFEGLDLRCVEKVAPAPFMISRSATAP